MKYIFCSMMFDDVELDIKKSIEPNAISGHKFQENILRGFLQNNADIYVINVPRVRHYPDYPEKKMVKKDFVFEGKTVGRSIGFNNRFILAYFSQLKSMRKELKKVISSNKDEQVVLLTFNSYLIQSINMLWIRNNSDKVILCDIIGDLHGKYGLLRDHATIKERLVDIYGQLEDHLAKKFDLFVFLSKYMTEAIPCTKEQYTIVEGIYNANATSTTTQIIREGNNKVLLYAGSLDVEYDIKHLINAFLLTDNESFRLYIAGNGNGLEYVKNAEKKDPRVKYLGVLSPDELLVYQYEATALISPRKNNHNYVKYSFPSKTMECLALGKPYIAHKLDSEPEEYAAYIQYAEETDEGLSSKIQEVLMMTEEERTQLGASAREFILNNKNAKKMCSKIMKLCEEYHQ